MATVTKADLIDAVRDEVGVTHREAAELVEGFIEMIAERLKDLVADGRTRTPKPVTSQSASARRNVACAGESNRISSSTADGIRPGSSLSRRSWSGLLFGAPV